MGMAAQARARRPPHGMLQPACAAFIRPRMQVKGPYPPLALAPRRGVCYHKGHMLEMAECGTLE